MWLPHPVRWIESAVDAFVKHHRRQSGVSWKTGPGNFLCEVSYNFEGPVVYTPDLGQTGITEHEENVWAKTPTFLEANRRT